MNTSDRNALEFIQDNLDIIKSRAVDLAPEADEERDGYVMEILRAVRSLEHELINNVLVFKPLPDRREGGAPMS